MLGGEPVQTEARRSRPDVDHPGRQEDGRRGAGELGGRSQGDPILAARGDRAVAVIVIGFRRFTGFDVGAIPCPARERPLPTVIVDVNQLTVDGTGRVAHQDHVRGAHRLREEQERGERPGAALMSSSVGLAQAFHSERLTR